MEDVYVIWWRYGDGSGSGVLRAYADRQRAEEDLELLNFDGHREYKLDELPIYRDSTPLPNGHRESEA